MGRRKIDARTSVVLAISVLAAGQLGGCAREESLEEHICARVADGDSDMEIARDLARDVDGDETEAGARAWLRGSVIPAKQNC